jgi:hypothetical protein
MGGETSAQTSQWAFHHRVDLSLSKMPTAQPKLPNFLRETPFESSMAREIPRHLWLLVLWHTSPKWRRAVGLGLGQKTPLKV